MATSIKMMVLHCMLLVMALLTFVDSIILIVWSHSQPDLYLHKYDSLHYWIFLFLIIFRLTSATIVLITGYFFGARYDKRKHLLGHIIYFLLALWLLFQIGVVLNYQESIWSLVIQIIHVYISMVYLFKSFLYHYDDQVDLRRSQSTEVDQSKNRNVIHSRYAKILYFINNNLLAFSTLFMIALSLFISLLLRKTIHKPWTERKLMKLKFIGEIFIRMLLSLIVPLIGTSIAYACTGFDPHSSGRIVTEVVSYYLITTAIATIEGLIMVTVIAPGHRIASFNFLNQTNKPANESHPPILIEDTILDMIRNVFTNSIFQSWISTYHTKLTPPPQGNETDIENWQINGEQEPGANVMSVLLLGVLIGWTATLIRTRGGRVIVELIEASNTIIMMITLAIVQMAPVCTVFLIIPQILSIDDVADMFRLIGWFTLTVLISLALHCLVVLSFIYLTFVRKNPYRFLGRMFPAISTAFATSSSSATMTVTMNCLEESVGLPTSIVRFVIPFGATVNMDGAALYEAVAAIFVAQYRQRQLNFGQLIIIALTAILVSIGAAGIPQAGMITTVIILNSIGLSLEDAALVMVVDFMLDRFRTVVNVLGDAFGAAVISARLKHLFVHDNANSSTDQLPRNVYTTTNSKLNPTTTNESISMKDLS